MYNLSFITDEYSQSLDEAIYYAVEAGFSLIELRTVNGKNLFDLPIVELQNMAEKIRSNNLSVSCLASPLLKWHPDHLEGLNSVNGRFHSFEHRRSNKLNVYQKAFEIADIFQTKYIRMFSYLKYPEYQNHDLKPDIKLLVDLACQYDKTLLLENEPVCNIDTLEKLYEIVKLINNPRVCALVDVGNIYEMGYYVSFDVLVKLAPFIKYLHIKDYSHDLNDYAVVGAGDVDFKEYFRELSRFLKLEQLTISLETHVKKEKKKATERSVKYLRDLLNGLNIN